MTLAGEKGRLGLIRQLAANYRTNPIGLRNVRKTAAVPDAPPESQRDFPRCGGALGRLFALEPGFYRTKPIFGFQTTGWEERERPV